MWIVYGFWKISYSFLFQKCQVIHSIIEQIWTDLEMKYYSLLSFNISYNTV